MRQPPRAVQEQLNAITAARTHLANTQRLLFSLMETSGERESSTPEREPFTRVGDVLWAGSTSLLVLEEELVHLSNQLRAENGTPSVKASLRMQQQRAGIIDAFRDALKEVKEKGVDAIREELGV